MSRSAMRTLLVIFVSLEVILAALSAAPVLVERQDLGRAVYNYRQAPTEEHRKVMKREQETTARTRSKTRLVLVALLAVNTCGLVVVYRRLRREPKVG